MTSRAPLLDDGEARLRRWHGEADRERADHWGLVVALLLCGLVAMGVCSRVVAGW